MTCIDPLGLLVILNVDWIFVSLGIELNIIGILFITNTFQSVYFIGFVRFFFWTICIKFAFRVLVFVESLFNFVNSMVCCWEIFLKIMIRLDWLSTSECMDRRRPATFVIYLLKGPINRWIIPRVLGRNDIHFPHWLINIIVLRCACWLRTHPLL